MLIITGETMFKLFIPLVSFLFFATTMNAQEEMSPDQKAWMEYMTPGPMHELMAKSVGEWKTTHTMWMDPEGEPMVSEGTSTVEMILGGRYLLAKDLGIVMGMPFEGINLQGYDNKTKEIISVWIDNFGTGIAISRGTYDEETKTINFTGSMINPVDGENLHYRQTHQFVDDNNHLFEMFMIKDGVEHKSMTLEFTR